jgi:tetratricopeptide (TPR) repeat protein
MTRRLFPVTGVLMATAVLTAQTAKPPQTFRTSTDVVVVDVAVRSGDKMIAGLGAADFVLTDNGVRQEIESVEATSVPIDLTLVVDVSGNPRRPWVKRLDASKVAGEIAEEVQQVTNLLRPTDRVRLLAIDRFVQQVWPLSPVSALPPIRIGEFDGLGAMYDTLAAAMLQPVEPARRHVVVARTKGVDTISALAAGDVRALVERADGLVHLVLMESALLSDTRLSAFQSSNMGLASPVNRSWVPYRTALLSVGEFTQLTEQGREVKAGVEAAGGGWHQAAVFSEPSLPGAFRKVFDDFRHSYVLRYTPRGVTRSGWHTLSVTTPKLRGVTINARRGYGIEEAPPPVVPPPVPAMPRTLAEMILAHERGAYQNLAAGLRQVPDLGRLIREFDEGGHPWPGAPAREAAFVIDLADAGLASSKPEVRTAAQALLERQMRLVRNPLEPDAFELLWLYTTVTLVQATVRPALIDTFAARALARFPDEPRFALAQAIAADLRSVSPGMPAAALTSRRNLESARALYEAIAGRPGIEAEVRIRLAFVLYRLGRHEEALARLTEQAPASIADAQLRYLHHLFRGHALVQLDRLDEAVAAYRAALEMLPPAQSARVALMTTLYRRGDRAEAEALAESVQSETALYTDPWWLYWQGQYRLYPLVAARLREVAR